MQNTMIGAEPVLFLNVPVSSTPYSLNALAFTFHVLRSCLAVYGLYSK